MTTPAKPASHPAKYGDDIIDAVRTFLDIVDPDQQLRVLDPFAGVGRIARLDRWAVAGEIEWDWTVQIPDPAVGVQLDATRLPFRTGTFDLWVSSVTYGNRLADDYDGKGRCRACAGHGVALDGSTCERCDGAGRDTSSRLTYRIALGRPLHHRNTGRLQWGPRYKVLHEQAYREAARVVRPGGGLILNVKDHDRAKVAQGVPAWHDATLRRLGFRRLAARSLSAKGYGENMNAGDHPEHVLVYAAPGPVPADTSRLVDTGPLLATAP